MNLNKVEKGLLGYLVQEISPVTEFEVRFGLPIRKFGGDRNRISRKKFIDTLRYFRDNYKIADSNTTLDITFKDPNGYNQNKIRVSLEGADTVREYCKTDVFDPSKATIVYKDNLYWKPKTMDKMINSRPSLWSEYEENGRKRRLTANYDSDLGVRFSVKTEVPIVYSGSGRNKYVIDPKCKSILKGDKLERFVYLDLDKFQLFDKNTLKTYRYKRRFSFMSPDELFRYDFTIVKSSRRNSRNKPEYTRSFTTSRVLDSLEEYELEMEYVGPVPVDAERLVKMIPEYVGAVLCRLQHTENPISISRINEVATNYKNLIVGNWVSRIRKRIKMLEGDKKEGHAKEINALNKRLKNYVYESDGREQLSDRVRLENTFIGPKPYTLELDNFGELAKNSKTIESDYSVTDKADGLRMLMFIDAEGDIYYIDNRFHIRSKSVGTYKAPKELYETVIDGEWVELRSDGSVLDKFLGFDIYFKGGKPTEDLPLSGKSGRYETMMDVFHTLEKGLKRKKIDIHEHFWYKQFYFTSSSKSIYELSETCYNADRDYNIDGLIFTPMSLPVGVDSVSKDKVPKRYAFNTTSGSWSKALKWKPLEEQSIDFFVEFETRDGKPVVLNRTVEIDGVEHTIRYKRMLLYVGANKMDKDLMMKMNPCSEVVGAVVSTKTGNYTVPMRFKPNFNAYEGVGVANVPVDERGRFLTVAGVRPGKIYGTVANTETINIRNHSVVEFVYDGKAPLGFRWKVLRIREDKTEEYDRLVNSRGVIYRSYMENRDAINSLLSFEEGHKYSMMERDMVNKLWRNCGALFRAFGVRMRGNIYERTGSLRDAMSLEGRSIVRGETDIPIHFSYGNYYTTAFNVWNAINNPVTNDMLFGKTPIPVLDDDRYYRSSVDREDDPTARMRQFHNKYIKSTLIHLAASGKTEPSLIDLCCGKGGDLYKWRSAGIKTVLGVDVSRDNIYNRNDGACVRWMNMARKTVPSERMSVDFLVGDCGELMSSLEAFTDERSSDYYRDTYLNMDGTPQKFDIVSTQFAIHYFFNSRSRIDAFLRNVSSHLENGGYFIGTVLDGASVYDRLCKNSDTDMIQRKDEAENLVWSIERKFEKCTRKDFYKADHPVNFEIEIRLPSITGEGTSYKEWLVNFEYLKRRASEHNLVLYRSRDIPGSDTFKKLYERSKKHGGIEMTDAECDLSFMYRYFVFKKQV